MTDAPEAADVARAFALGRPAGPCSPAARGEQIVTRPLTLGTIGRLVEALAG